MHATAAIKPGPGSDQDALGTFRAPPGAGTLGLVLFIAGLAVAFVWLLVGYALTRARGPAEALSVPVWFWFSTFVILVSGVSLQGSYLWAKAGRIAISGRALLVSTILGVGFLLLQVPGLIQLLNSHREMADSPTALYLLALVLVSLHGFHVLGGLGRMLVLNRRNHKDAAEANGGAHLKQMCLYWHFLAIVWLAMFGVILWA